MKRYSIIAFTILLGLIVITSSSKSQDDKSTKKKKPSMVINIKGSDTTYNGKTYDELSNEEKERLNKIHEEINQKHKEIDEKMREFEKLHSLRAPNPHKHPKSPRHPKAPSAFNRSESRVIVIPEIPDVPNAEYFKEFSVAPFNFSFDSGFPAEGTQSFTFNDGDKY